MSNILKDWFPQDDSDRYITMAGDPIHSPLAESFFKAADFKAAVLATMASGLINYNHGGVPFKEMSLIFGLNNFLSIALRGAEILMIDKNLKRNDLCIDTRPDSKTPPTSPDLVYAAYKTRNYFGLYMGLTVAFIPTNVVPAMMHSDTKANIEAGLVTASAFTRLIKSFRRFNNVVDGRWAIVDTPPPEKVTELVPAHANI